MDSSIHETSNILLRQLDREGMELLRPHLARIDVKREYHFSAAGGPLQTVYFPEGGVASCVAVEGSARTEVGLIGREGMVGVNAILHDNISPFETYMQVDGTTVLAMPGGELLRAMDQCSPMRQLLSRYVHCFMLQVSYAVVASSQHLLEARLARWLLMCHDRVEGDDIPLTHEFMALMISAQRSGVTVALHSLEGSGMIRSTRGLVTMRDRAKLEELAGDSYGIPEARYRELIGPFGKQTDNAGDELANPR